RFADDLAAEAHKLPPEYVFRIDYKVDEEKKYYDTYWYEVAPLEDLVFARNDLRERVRRRKLEASPLYVRLDGDEESAPNAAAGKGAEAAGPGGAAPSAGATADASKPKE